MGDRINGPLYPEIKTRPMSDCHRVLWTEGRNSVCVSEDGQRIAMEGPLGVHSMEIRQWIEGNVRRSLLEGIRTEAISECEKWRDHHAASGKLERALYWSTLAEKWRDGAHPSFGNRTGVTDPDWDSMRERIAALEADRDKWHGTAKQQVATLVEAGKIQGELREKVESLEAALAGAVPREVAERACDLMGGMFHKMSRHPEQFGEWHVVGDPEKSVPPFAEQNPEIDPTIRKWSGPAIARALAEHAASAARGKGDSADA